jgi:hypothetical protein
MLAQIVVGFLTRPLHHRARGRRSIEEKARSQQYLAPYEENALVHFSPQLFDLGQPVRIKHIRFLAFCVTRQRPETNRPLKPPGKNWTQVLSNAIHTSEKS